MPKSKVSKFDSASSTSLWDIEIYTVEHTRRQMDRQTNRHGSIDSTMVRDEKYIIAHI